MTTTPKSEEGYYPSTVSIHFPAFVYHKKNRSGQSFFVCDTAKLKWNLTRGASLNWEGDWDMTANDLPAGLIDAAGQHFEISKIITLPRPPFFLLRLPFTLFLVLSVGFWRRFRFGTPSTVTLAEFKKRAASEMARSRWTPDLIKNLKASKTFLEAFEALGYETEKRIIVGSKFNTEIAPRFRRPPHSEIVSNWK